MVERALVPVAAPSPGVCCESCRSGVGQHYLRCGPCNRHRVPAVMPISMSLHGSPLHSRLRGYKDSDKSDERREHCLALAALLGLFLEHHRCCLGGRPDFVVTVPSAARDAFAAVVDLLGDLRDRRVDALRAIGAGDVTHYELIASQVRGKAVLLVDDTFTSGKSIAAAHRALTEGGAKILGPLVMGRHFHPEFETSVSLWECLKGREWSLNRCARCGPVDCADSPSQSSML